MRMRALFRVQLGPRYTSWAKTKESGAGMFLCLMGSLGQLRTWLLIYHHHYQAYGASVFLSLAICPLLLSAKKKTVLFYSTSIYQTFKSQLSTSDTALLLLSCVLRSIFTLFENASFTFFSDPLVLF